MMEEWTYEEQRHEDNSASLSVSRGSEKKKLKRECSTDVSRSCVLVHGEDQLCYHVSIGSS